MIALLLALTVTVEPAFLPCRPSFGAGAAIVDAKSTESRRVSVELADFLGRIAIVELDLPARSHKRLLVMPPLNGRVTATLVEEEGTRTPLAYPARVECAGPSIAALLRDDGTTGVDLPGDIGGTTIERGTITADDLTGSWRPLLALDAIAAESRALHELSDSEWGTLAGWVRAGGVLVVVPGIDPGPFFRGGRLPAGLGSAGPWQSTRLGAGFVVVMPDPSSADPRLGGVLAVAVDSRDRWITALGRVLEAQRDRAGPAGRASRPAGVLSLGVCLLAAAAAHELLRRRFVVGTRDFPRYFQGLAIVLGVSSVAGLLSAFVGRDPGSSLALVLARSSGSGSRSAPFLLGNGRTRAIAENAWPFSERDVHFVLGARSAVTNPATSVRVVLERTPFELGGTVSLVGGSMLRNDTPIRFESGWIVDKSGCSAVPSIGPGEELRHTSHGLCPATADVRLVSETTNTGIVWYVARSGETVYAISMEAPP